MPQIEARIKLAEIDPHKITAILLTHEHDDHIRGLAKFLQKYNNCKLFIHTDAKDIVTKYLHTHRFHEFKQIIFDKPYSIGDINIGFFKVPHDSQFCFGYTFESDSAKVSLATDIGHITTEIIDAMSKSQIAILESNHDLAKLSANVKYPVVLKRRITGSLGHLSNTAACLAIYELAKANVGQIILAHLSEQNNSPTLAFSFVCDFLARKGISEGIDISIDVAAQDQIGRLFKIN